MTLALLVVDSSALIAVLCDAGPDGEWAADQLAAAELVAPELVMFETANILRRLELIGDLTSGEAAGAHGDLLTLRLTLWPYAALAESIWRLRGSATCYDGAYVALAEQLEAPLVTLDRRLARGMTGRCEIRTPG